MFAYVYVCMHAYLQAAHVSNSKVARIQEIKAKQSLCYTYAQVSIGSKAGFFS